LAAAGADVFKGCVINAVEGGGAVIIVETTPLGGVSTISEPSNAVNTTRTASPDAPTMVMPPI
jgi:hypothetical protein